MSEQQAQSPSGEPTTPETKTHPLLEVLASEFKIPKEKLLEIEGEFLVAPMGVLELKQMIVSRKITSPDVVQQALARLFSLEFRPGLEEAEVYDDFIKAIPIRYVKKFMFFPISMDEEEMVVAVENPEFSEPIEDVAKKFGKRVKTVISTHNSILNLINRAYDRSESTPDEVIEDADAASSGDSGIGWGIEEPEDLIDARDEEPIKKLLNSVLYQATKSNASDVHIDSTGKEVMVRFRVDGVLHTTLNLPKSIQRTLINRIKIMSRLDISQRGLPQDGRTLIVVAGRKIDIRVSTLPTVNGEKAVLRLLYQDQDLFNLEQLGLPENIYARVRALVKQSGGIILVSGPTGSGKTTTLYSALQEIDRQSKNIMTIEDPVEYKMPGYVQVEVNNKLGLSFANALRSVLRQDPDVIMVGEMRDRETALIAIQAALTGHTVFSTVHTNSAPATVARLVDMGIEPYLITSTVYAVLAQRLVRRICKNCKEETPKDKALLMELGLNSGEISKWKKMYRGAGCPQCKGTGYQGRVGLFELLEMGEKVKNITLQTSEAGAIRDAAISEGMQSMRSYGIALVKEGKTTVEEVLSTTRDD